MVHQQEILDYAHAGVGGMLVVIKTSVGRVGTGTEN